MHGRRPEHDRPERHVPTSTAVEDKALLVGCYLSRDPETHEPPLTELRRLADSAGVQVVGTLIQHRDRGSAGLFLGKGKVEELGELARASNATLVVFDNDLRPAQSRNLEEALGLRVVDRTELILDIFAMQASSRQAKFQVELAQLEYSLPRLKRLWTHLDASQGGVGFRGPGEKQLEKDKRIIQRRIQTLKHDLSDIRERRERMVETRSGDFTVSLVGYTNAGKSTLLNRLTGSDELVEDRLFATLDTKTNLWNLGCTRQVLLSDTVGFIKNIPHHLIESFHATLEEVTRADLLLHVVDAAHPDCQLQIDSVRRVLDKIGAGQKPTLLVLNKVDAIQDQGDMGYLLNRHKGALPISARTGKGISDLEKFVREQAESGNKEVVLEVPAGDGRLVAFLESRGRVLERSYTGDMVEMRLRLSNADLAKARSMLAASRPGAAGGTF